MEASRRCPRVWFCPAVVAPGSDVEESLPCESMVRLREEGGEAAQREVRGAEVTGNPHVAPIAPARAEAQEKRKSFSFPAQGQAEGCFTKRVGQASNNPGCSPLAVFVLFLCVFLPNQAYTALFSSP